MSTTSSFVPVTPEERAAFVEMSTQNQGEPAVAPAAVVEPSTPTPDPSEFQESIQSLAEVQAQTQAQLAALTATLLAERGEDSSGNDGVDESLADESEAVRALAAKFSEAEKKLAEVTAKLQVRESAELEQQQQESLLADGQALFNQFPGLNEGDFKKIYSKIAESEDVASRLSVEQVAVEVLGVSYLADRRKAAAPAPRNTSVPGSEPPPATLVDTSGPGGGGSGGGSPATGSIRDACQSALLTDRHKFGKFS